MNDFHIQYDNVAFCCIKLHKKAKKRVKFVNRASKMDVIDNQLHPFDKSKAK